MNKWTKRASERKRDTKRPCEIGKIMAANTFGLNFSSEKKTTERKIGRRLVMLNLIRLIRPIPTSIATHRKEQSVLTFQTDHFSSN